MKKFRRFTAPLIWVQTVLCRWCNRSEAQHVGRVKLCPVQHEYTVSE